MNSREMITASLIGARLKLSIFREVSNYSSIGTVSTSSQYLLKVTPWKVERGCLAVTDF